MLSELNTLLEPYHTILLAITTAVVLYYLLRTTNFSLIFTTNTPVVASFNPHNPLRHVNEKTGFNL
jgi:hypothetical protein